MFVNLAQSGWVGGTTRQCDRALREPTPQPAQQRRLRQLLHPLRRRRLRLREMWLIPRRDN